MIIHYDAPAIQIQIPHAITGKPHIVQFKTPPTFVKPTGGDNEHLDFCASCLQDSIFINGRCHWCGEC